MWLVLFIKLQVKDGCLCIKAWFALLLLEIHILNVIIDKYDAHILNVNHSHIWCLYFHIVNLQKQNKGFHPSCRNAYFKCESSFTYQLAPASVKWQLCSSYFSKVSFRARWTNLDWGSTSNNLSRSPMFINFLHNFYCWRICEWYYLKLFSHLFGNPKSNKYWVRSSFPKNTHWGTRIMVEKDLNYGKINSQQGRFPNMQASATFSFLNFILNFGLNPNTTFEKWFLSSYSNLLLHNFLNIKGRFFSHKY